MPIIIIIIISIIIIFIITIMMMIIMVIITIHYHHNHEPHCDHHNQHHDQQHDYDYHHDKHYDTIMVINMIIIVILMMIIFNMIIMNVVIIMIITPQYLNSSSSSNDARMTEIKWKHICISVNAIFIPSKRWGSFPDGSCPIIIMVIFTQCVLYELISPGKVASMVSTAQHQQFTFDIVYWSYFISYIFLFTTDIFLFEPKYIINIYWYQTRTTFFVFCTWNAVGLVELLDILLVGLIELLHNFLCEVCGRDPWVTTRVVLDCTYQFRIFTCVNVLILERYMQY